MSLSLAKNDFEWFFMQKMMESRDLGISEAFMEKIPVSMATQIPK